MTRNILRSVARGAIVVGVLTLFTGQIILALVLIAAGLLGHGALAERPRTGLMKAIEDGDLAQVRALLEGGADPNLTDKTGEKPLLLAVQRGRQDIVDLLLEKGAKANPAAKIDESALTWAATQGDSGIVKRLVDAGAAPTSQRHGVLGQTTLEAAIESNDPEVVRTIIAAARPSASEITKTLNRFHDTWHTLRVDIVQQCLDAGADPSTVFDNAITFQRADLARLMLAAGVSPDYEQALVRTAINGNVEIAKVLLNAGADLGVKNRDTEATRISGFNGKTALQLAEMQGHRVMADLLRVAAGR